MSGLWQKLWNNKCLLIGLLLLVANLGLVFYYYDLKTGLHVDEQWSYAHANSSQGAFLNDKIDASFRDEDMSSLFNTWLEYPFFHDYLTVQPNETFSYKHIWDNLKKGVHPPLYYVLLHTVCSFFPDSFSKWYGAGLNMVIWTALLIMLFKLAELLYKDDKTALIAVAFYAFSMVGFNSVLFIRMYLLQTLWAVCLIYQTLLMMDDKVFYKKRVFYVFLFAALGNVTNYNSVIFALVISMVCGVLWLLRKEYKKLAGFAGAMLGSVLFLFAFFPSAWQVVSGSSRGKELISQYESFDTLIILLLIPMMLGVKVFLMRRKQQKVLRVMDWLVDILFAAWVLFFYTTDLMLPDSVVPYLFSRLLHFNNVENMGFAIVLLAILIFFFKINCMRKKPLVLFCITVLMATYLGLSMPEMWYFKDRYFFMIMPLTAVLLGYLYIDLADRFVGDYKSKIWLMAVLVFVNSCIANFEKNSPYAFIADEHDKEIWEQIKGKPVFVIASEKWLIYETAFYLQDASKLYMLHNELNLNFVRELFRNRDAFVLVISKDIRYASNFDYPEERRKINERLDSWLEFISAVRVSERFYDVYKVK